MAYLKNCKGNKVVLNCIVFSHICYILLAANNMPDKMHLANDGTELIISDVCKNCADGSSDLQVIQCNASNVHGYAFGDGYINVLGNKDYHWFQYVSVCR